jgi:hypothetical protein
MPLHLAQLLPWYPLQMRVLFWDALPACATWQLSWDRRSVRSCLRRGLFQVLCHIVDKLQGHAIVVFGLAEELAQVGTLPLTLWLQKLLNISL